MVPGGKVFSRAQITCCSIFELDQIRLASFFRSHVLCTQNIE